MHTFQAMRRLIWAVENTALYLIVAVLLGLSVYQIVLRNVFDSGLYWADPLLRVLVLWLAMFGAMVATRETGHIRIDALTHYLSPRLKPLANLVVSLFSAAVCFVAAWYGYLFVLDEREYGMTAFAEVPAWLCQSIIPFGLAVIGLRMFIQAFTGLRGEGNEEPAR